MVVDPGREFGDFLGRRRDPGLALLVGEADQGVLVGDVEIALDEGEAVGGVEIGDEDGLRFGDAVAIGIAQQRDTVAALDLGIALFLDRSGDDVLGGCGWPC